MKTPTPSRIPLVIASCVAMALAACDQKSASTDPAKERQLQDMQTKLDQLSAQSTELNRQLADRDAADAESKREQLKKEQADLDNQRVALESERNALASNQKKPVYVRTESTTTDDAPEPVYQGKPATYEVFYDKLQDDGDWIESDDYGYIWQPRVSRDNRRWRPYTDGRWVETDRGWTWESNERFGWATYHYGRWVNLADTGWCWVPGDEWAPAWVSWRSSDSYVGWAPLPPEARLQRGGSITASVDVGYDTGPEFYTFVDTQDFGEETYVGRVVEPERNVTIINQTVNVTNITYSETNIYNYGPDVEVMRRHSRRPIQRYELELNRDPRFDRDSARPQARGDRLSIVAPLFAAASQRGGNNDVRPARVERKVAKVERDNGWRGVRPEQREAVKADLQKQADRQVQTQQADRERQRSLKARNDARQAQREQSAAVATPAANPTPANSSERTQPTPTVAPRATPERSPNAQTKARREAMQRRQAEQQAVQATPTATPERSATPDATSQRPEPSATPVERPTPLVMPKPDRSTTPTRPDVTPSRPEQANRPPINEQQKARREAAQATSPVEATPTRPLPTPFVRPSAPADVPETTRPQRQPQAQQAEPDTSRQQAAAQAAREQQQRNAQAQALRERRQAAQQQAAPVEREVARPRQPDTSTDPAPAARRQQQPDTQRERAARPERPAQRQPKVTRGNPAEATESPTPQ
ncbi:MAG: DUF6600 domain-containing protein [Chthoniobacterales bacterium]